MSSVGRSPLSAVMWTNFASAWGRAETLLKRDTDQSDASGVLLALAEPFHGLGGPAGTATLPEAVIVNRLY